MGVERSFDRELLATETGERWRQDAFVNEVENARPRDVGRRDLEVRALRDAEVVLEPLGELPLELWTTKRERCPQVSPVVLLDTRARLERVQHGWPSLRSRWINRLAATKS